MNEYKDLIELVKQLTGASPIIANCLLSIGGKKDVNLNRLIENIEANKEYFIEVSEMTGL